MHVLAFANQKGGCGKTTTAVHLAGALAAAERRVLVVDLDPQAHATLALSCAPGDRPGLAEVLGGRARPADAIRSAPGGIDLLPATAALAEVEETAARELGAEHLLVAALEELEERYDLVLLDCPPRVDGLLCANALTACDTVVLVIESGAFALQGALRARELFEEKCGERDRPFALRVLATLFDRRLRIARDLLVATQARFGSELFDAVIHTSVRLREAAAFGVPVQELDRRCRATRDFRALAEEVVDHVDATPRTRPSARRRGSPDVVLRPAPPSRRRPGGDRPREPRTPMDSLALLCTLHAEGPATRERLVAAGIHTIDDVLATSVRELDRLLAAGPGAGGRFAREARLLLDRVGALDPEESGAAPESSPAPPSAASLRSPRADPARRPTPPRRTRPAAPSPTPAPAAALLLAAPAAAPADAPPVAAPPADPPPAEPAVRATPAPEPPRPTATPLAPDLFDGLTPELCEGLRSAGVSTCAELAAASGLSLARRVGAPFVLVMELQLRAQRLAGELAKAPVRAAGRPERTGRRRSAVRTTRWTGVDPEPALVADPSPGARARRFTDRRSSGRDLESSGAGGPFA